jgi:hypothetical protein
MSEAVSAAEGTQVLSLLQDLQQLTYLALTCDWHGQQQQSPPAAAFSALTASSKLQYLNVEDTMLPVGAWQHMFPDGRQLPCLHTLKMSWPLLPRINPEVLHEDVTKVSSLVSCGPALAVLCLERLPYDAKLMEQLTALTGLHTLHLDVLDGSQQHAVECIYRPTGLRGLDAAFKRRYGTATSVGMLLTALRWYDNAWRVLQLSDHEVSLQVGTYGFEVQWFPVEVA